MRWVFGKALLLLLPVALLLGIGELAARTYTFTRNGFDLNYLSAPFRNDIRPRALLPYEPTGTLSMFDTCSGRWITLTINGIGARGAEWSREKPKGTYRILAVGGSSTFGVNNPDAATWPVFLERILRDDYGLEVEVLNAGQPGVGLESYLETFLERWVEFHPDMAIYYEAWNNANFTVSPKLDRQVASLHRGSWMGSLSDALYNRSMLYTTLAEWVQFRLARKSGEAILPPVEPFRSVLSEWFHRVREFGAVPVAVLQVFDTPPESSRLERLDLDDRRKVLEFILEASRSNPSTINHMLSKVRAYKAQVLVEQVRRTAEELGVPVIDPRPAFGEHGERGRLFCDVVHLTDLGNEFLARSIARQLHPLVRRRRLESER